MQITYSAFGGVRVSVEGVDAAIGRAREREVLATLIASRGAPVTADRLATDIWGADSGPSTVPLVQVAVSRLRSLIEPERAKRGGQLIVNESGGYVLRAATSDVDVWMFEQLAGDVLGAEHPPAHILAMCEEAAGLWSRPYAGIQAPGPQRHADRLTELHADLQIEHGKALLDLDRPDAAARLLAQVAHAHPFREPLWCLLALAQYRSGRQADALAAIRQLRAAIGDELGADPVPRTLELEAAILRQDVSLLIAAAPSPLEPDPRPLIGRSDELDVGVQLLGAAQARRTTRLLMVTGEGGIGKTAYLEALQLEARRRGFRVLVGRSHPDELAPALWPWTEIVRELVAENAPDELGALQNVLGLAPAANSPVHTFDAIVSLLADRGARTPLLLVIEDLHWADTASLRMLRHLAQARLDAPVIVAVARRVNSDPSPDLLDCLTALARADVTRIQLDGLSGDAVGELLETAASGCSTDLAAFVADVTGGNPFFVLQYAGLLATRSDLDDLDPTTLDVPESITDVLRQRLRWLPEPALAVVLAAAVFGRSFEAGAVAALAERPIDEVLDALDLATLVGLTSKDGPGCAFVHSLAQDAAYRELTSGQRIRLHDRAGRVLEDLSGEQASAATSIAHHAWAAAGMSPAHRDRAVAWRIRAAEVELSRHAAPEALALWRDVLAAVPAGSVLAARAHGGIAVALMHLSEIGAAGFEIEAGVELARRLEEWDLIVELVATLAAAGPWAWPTHGRRDATLVDNLRAALPHIETGPRALLLAVIEVELFVLGRDEERGHYAAEALDISRGADKDLRRRVLLFVTVGTTGIWPPHRRLAAIQELLELDPADDVLINALLTLAVVEWENRHPEAADAAMERGVAVARRLGTAAVDVPHAWWKATRARDRGDLDADDLLSTAVDLQRRTGGDSYVDAQVLAAARRRRGTDARELLSGCPTPPSRTVQAILAHALLEVGDVERARSLMLRWEDRAPDDHDDMVGACFQLLVLAELGSADQIRDAVHRLEPLEGFAVVLSAMTDHCGVIDHFLAVGYAALGDPRAVSMAAQAQRANQELGCGPWADRSAQLVASLTRP